MNTELVQRLRAAVDTIREARQEVAAQGRSTHLPEWFDDTLIRLANDWERTLQIRAAGSAVVEDLARDLCDATFTENHWEKTPSVHEAFRRKARRLVANGWGKRVAK